jgi:hypothetical protein
MTVEIHASRFRGFMSSSSRLSRLWIMEQVWQQASAWAVGGFHVWPHVAQVRIPYGADAGFVI